MATAKQTRAVIKKIRYHMYKLQRALNEAHYKKILVYDDYKTQSPCSSMDEVRERVKTTTKEACYTAFIDEIKQEEW